METSLHVIKASKYGDFDVSTCLFTARMETRVFSNSDDYIPLEIVEKVRELRIVAQNECVGAFLVTDQPAWDDYNSVYSKHLFHGLAVESFAFSDAHYLHAAVGKIVEDFLNDHKRVVQYVKK